MVAASGPPSSKGNAPTVPLLQQQPGASCSSKRIGKVPETLSSHGTSQIKDKDKETHAVPKHRSMRILQTRFAGTRQSKGEDSGPKKLGLAPMSKGAFAAQVARMRTSTRTNITAVIKAPTRIPTFPWRNQLTQTYLLGLLATVSSRCCMLVVVAHDSYPASFLQVVPFVKDTVDRPSEANLSFPAAITDTLRAAGKVKSTPQGAEDTLPIPFLGTSYVAADTTLHLPAVLLLAPPLGTPDAAADTSLQLPAALPPTSPCLGTPDTAAGTSPQLPAAQPPTPPFLVTLNTATGTSPQLPAAPPPTPPFLVTSDTASGTSSQLPAVLSRGEIIDAGHKNDDASISMGHLSEKNMSWEDWENSFMAFKAFFDGGVTILRSIDELLPLCHRFNGYVTFQGTLVYPEMVEVLRKFMDKYGSFMEVIDVTSSFSRCTALQALGLVLHGIDTMQLLDITDHILLCWRDVICEAIILGFHVDFLLKLMRDLARIVKAIADALNIKQQELENQRWEMHALLLPKGISADNAECVTEAAARSSPRASSVLFGHSS
ncbi:uncharacterized protein Pyn_23520 [Prunus yedoensis var. nudiflora]|uniref:Uncharacterized protein n=1 Tax=Prunus yedoensis var. nudiflora TaxID=2094558 RepID=A0A315AW00_PRUYE|nr:uncharacterized protein Pyn_23520 [Prunus yedoensis var. nudiflora]